MSGGRRSDREKQHAQHFLRRGALARSLVARASLSRADCVVEIGAGRGALTKPLAARAGRVVAIELDAALYAELRARFAALPHVEPVHGDYFAVAPPECSYRVFANVPFHRSADVLRRISEGEHPPADAHLILEDRAAERFAGRPFARETLWSLRLKPWWHVEILERLSPTDFSPPPRAKPVLLWLLRRDRALVSRREHGLYADFVAHAFGREGDTVRRCLSDLLSPKQIHRLARDLGFAERARPSDLEFSQWLGLFRFFAAHGDRRRVRRVRGARDRLPR